MSREIEQGGFTEYRHELWKKSGGENPLGVYKSFQEAFNSAAILGENGFNDPQLPGIITCIDEGIAGGDVETVFNLPQNTPMYRIAGAGVIHADITDVIRASSRDLLGVVTHKRCGASGLYAEQNNLKGNPDDLGGKKAADIAKSLDIEYLSHILPSKRPKELHDARAVYYDGTSDGFEPSRISTLPSGFGISRGFSGSIIARKDLEVARSIATGDHGFGKHFTPETPFYFVAITDGNDRSIPMVHLAQELEAVRDSAPHIKVATIQIPRN